VIALVETAEGVVSVDLEDETILTVDAGAALDPPPELSVGLPRVLSAVAAGSTIVCLVAAKPPLVVSHDAGRTWRESGRGLPGGVAVAVCADHPDLLLYAAADRLYLSRDGGRFWRALALELPGIERVAFAD
jgi:photosystem II stability/assembly factor-like uncharacterized protein